MLVTFDFQEHAFDADAIPEPVDEVCLMDGGVDGDYEDFTEYSERATAHAAGLLLIVVSAFWD